MASTATTPPRALARALRPFQRFTQMEASGGIVLLACTALALAWANSPWAGSYHHLWEIPITIGAPGAGLTLSLHQWVNDGLMAVFFFLVGLEIKREVLIGELASRRTAALPMVAALGGMVVPASLYAALNAGSPGSPGWGIPMATDIAFALGVLTLLGSRVPLGLKVFLAALAIADDIGAVIVIAVFYTSDLAWSGFFWTVIVLLVLTLMNRFGVRYLPLYAVLGVVLWLAVHASGVHATIAGVLLALTIPARTKQEAVQAIESACKAAQAPLQKMEHKLHGPVAFGIMPLFALANAGVALGGTVGTSSRVMLGVILGLFVGKPLGITLASWLACRARIAELPTGVSWREIHGAAWLGGIGFTMSLFIAGLAFNDARLNAAKLGILTASFCAGTVGWLVLRTARTPRR